MSLRIQVDARLLTAGGIGRYLREITGRWLGCAAVDRIRFFGRPAELEPFLAEHDRGGRAEIVPWADGPYSLVAQLRWPVLARRESWTPDVSFFPHYDVPLMAHPAPSLVVVHDLIHFQVPDAFPAWKRAFGLGLLRGALERATAVATVSRVSRHAICGFVPAVADKVHVVPNGVGEAFGPLDERERADAHERWGALRPFILCVGPDKPHKNLAHAVRTLARLPACEGWRLVWVGATRDEGARLASRAGHVELVPKVVAKERVTDAELRALYSLAGAVVVPSVLEGFGLPVLEGRACGAKVLAGDLQWARELRESGVILVPGWSPERWAETVRARPAAGSSVPRPAPTREKWGWNRTAERTFELLLRAREVGEPWGSA